MNDVGRPVGQQRTRKGVVPMPKRFELHLVDMDAPEGLIDADRLVEIVTSLQEMATRLGRLETNSALRGRPPRGLDRVAALRIGLQGGSTTIIAERVTGHGAFEFDMHDEESVDRRFAELIESVGSDQRPDWVTGSLASSADDLVAALKRTAPIVELKVDGVSRKTFKTEAIHRETWKATPPQDTEAEVTFTGRLFAVNLLTHRLQVQDDAGHQVALPRVSDDLEAGRLVGQYVTVTGTPQVASNGQLTQISGAAVSLAPDPIGDQRVAAGVSLAEILAGAPGPTPGGIPGLTDAEIEAFLEATR